MHSNRDDDGLLAGFGAMINAMGGGGDTGNLFPASDANDLSRGARFIPGQVTDIRRAGKTVTFVTECGPCCWHWQLPDGSRIYHFDRHAYEQIARTNGHTWEGAFSGDAGRCPECGNPHTSGGVIESEDANV